MHMYNRKKYFTKNCLTNACYTIIKFDYITFQIKDNVQQIFGKFLNEGKATIRFKEPEQDLCLSKVRSKILI